jgi:hemerythrin-like domain-containing protein
MMTNHITAGKPAPAYSHAQFERATQLLSDEHRVIERVLNVLEELTRNRGEVPLQTWKKALEFVRGFADQCHHLKEEKLLFPTLEEHGIPSEGGPVGMMLMEHEEGRSYVRSMLAAVEMLEAKNEGGREALLDGARAYVRLLREHIQKEDDVLFPWLTRLFLPPGKRSFCAPSKNMRPKRWVPEFMRNISRSPKSSKPALPNARGSAASTIRHSATDLSFTPKNN